MEEQNNEEIYFSNKIFVEYLSTAVEQAVACAPVTQRARVRSLVETSFLGEVFFGILSYL